MATILCHYSGIEFRCEHFPIHLTSGESHHPIFDAPLPKLWKYFSKWQAGELTETDSYLLFIAYMRATEMVDFRTAIRRTPATPKISYNWPRYHNQTSGILHPTICNYH